MSQAKSKAQPVNRSDFSSLNPSTTRRLKGSTSASKNDRVNSLDGPQKHKTISVCFWNILFDVFSPSLAKPQEERLPKIIADLQKLPPETVFGFGEVEGDNGSVLAANLKAKNCAFSQYGRPRNHIGSATKLDSVMDVVMLGKRCKAVITKAQGIAIVTVHLPLIIVGRYRHTLQVRQLLKSLDLTMPTVIMGDFNSLPWHHSRRYLEGQGFKSAFKPIGRAKRQATAPSLAYQHIYPWPLNLFGKIGFVADDIYVRGLTVENRGTIEGESDHKAVWANLYL